jgi:hypothetical protein
MDMLSRKTFTINKTLPNEQIAHAEITFFPAPRRGLSSRLARLLATRIAEQIIAEQTAPTMADLRYL